MSFYSFWVAVSPQNHGQTAPVATMDASDCDENEPLSLFFVHSVEGMFRLSRVFISNFIIMGLHSVKTKCTKIAL